LSRWQEAKRKAINECLGKQTLVTDSWARVQARAKTICGEIDKAAQTAGESASEPVSTSDHERDAIIAQVDAELAAKQERARRSLEEHAAKERCQEANKRCHDAIEKLYRSEANAPLPDYEPLFISVRDELLEMCRVLKHAGYEKTWTEKKSKLNPVNLIARHSHLTEISFKWAKRLLGRGFGGELVLNDIQTTWEKEPLRNALVWVRILINWLLKEFRFDMLPDESSIATSPQIERPTDESLGDRQMMIYPRTDLSLDTVK
jgi:hypothetical protein